MNAENETTQEEAMIVHITQDLMMSSNASAAAREKGSKFRFIKTADRALELIGENNVTHLLIDLQTPGLEIGDLGQRLQSVNEDRRPKAVAYAQHVETDLLETANGANFDGVMTRGQFHHNVREIIS